MIFVGCSVHVDAVRVHGLVHHGRADVVHPDLLQRADVTGADRRFVRIVARAIQIEAEGSPVGGGGRRGRRTWRGRRRRSLPGRSGDVVVLNLRGRQHLSGVHRDFVDRSAEGRIAVRRIVADRKTVAGGIILEFPRYGPGGVLNAVDVETPRGAVVRCGDVVRGVRRKMDRRADLQHASRGVKLGEDLAVCSEEQPIRRVRRVAAVSGHERVDRRRFRKRQPRLERYRRSGL